MTTTDARSSETVPEDATEYVEWALEQVGGAGKFQWMHVLCLSACWGYCGPLLAFQNIFAVKERDPVDCSRHPHIHAHPDHSIAATFDLVCGNEGLLPVLATLFFLGVMMGVVFWGNAADQHGRRTMFSYCVLVQQFGTLSMSLAPSYEFFACGIFITGFGNSGFGLISFMWMSEVVGAQLRWVPAVFPNVLLSIGQALLSVFAYAMPQWRRLNIAIVALGTVFYSFGFIFPESPKWLASQGRLEELHDVMKTFARINGCPVPAPLLLRQASSTKAKAAAAGAAAGGEPVLSQLMDRRVCFQFLAVGFGWFAATMCFYGLNLNAVSLPLSIYWANAMSGLICIPAYVFSGLLIEWPPLGRRGAVAAGFLVSGTCLLLSMWGSPMVLTILHYVALSAVSLSFAVIYVWSGELFPTDIRGTTIGLHSLCGRLGAMIAPFVAALGSEASTTSSLMVFGFVVLIAGMLSLFVPDTLGKTPPGTLADLDECEETPLSVGMKV